METVDRLLLTDRQRLWLGRPRSTSLGCRSPAHSLHPAYYYVDPYREDISIESHQRTFLKSLDIAARSRPPMFTLV